MSEPPILSPQSFHDSITEALKAIPPHHSGALLLDGKVQGDERTASALLVQRVGKDWVIAAGGSWSNAHGVSGQVAIMGSW